MDTIKYKEHVDQHIANVKQVWEDIQPLLTGEFWFDDFDWWNMSETIREHDRSKYGPGEFTQYTQWFYPMDSKNKDRGRFLRGWNHHQKANPHHWQYWLMWEEGDTTALKMPFIYIFEMLCDWTAMAYKFGSIPLNWYNKEKGNMFLHESTQKTIDLWIDLFNKIAAAHHKEKL